MDRSIRALKWKRPADDQFTNVTDALVEGIVSATPHPDPEIDRPKGYSLELTLRPDSTAFADELQAALLDVDPSLVTLQLDGVEAPISAVPVGVSKVPHLGERNDAELSVKPEGHEQFHEHF
ncbi:MAG: hypothetical protein ABEL97_13895 [Salinibacter sp.]